MSLQNILDPEAVKKEWTQLYAKNLTVTQLDTETINVTGNAPTTFFDLEVTNELQVDGLTDIGGNNYVTPDLGNPNYSLHTDGAGQTFWAPDDTGSSDVSYSGVPPTVVGQLSRFSSTTGGNIDQSAITDDGVNLNLNNQNITNVNLVDGVDVGAIDSTYLKLDGTNSMTGDLNMNNFDINFATNGKFFNRLDVVTELTPDSGLNLVPGSGLTSRLSFGPAGAPVITMQTNSFAGDNLQITDGTTTFSSYNRFNKSIEVDRIDEINANVGVTVDGVLLKDGQVDGVDVGAFKSDYDSNVNQDVRTTASPTFNRVTTSISGQTIPALWPETGVIVGGNNTNLAAIQMLTTATGTAGLRFGDNSSANNAGIFWDNNNNNVAVSTGGVVRLRVDATEIKAITDNFTIGTTSGGGGNQYTLTSGRGSNGQYLQTLGDGTTQWADSGDVSGGAGSTDNAIVRYDGATGKLIQNSNAILDDAGLLTLNGGLLVNSGDAVISDGNCLKLGSTSSTSNMKCVKITLTAGETIAQGLVCKIASSGKVETVKAGDADSTGVIGISATSSVLDADIDICIGGIFEAVIQNGETINAGDLVEKSDVGGQDGRVFAAAASTGTFGVCLVGGTGDAGGTVRIKGLFKKNESF